MDLGILDGLIYGYRSIRRAGVALVTRNVLNFASGFTVVDNPATGATDVSVQTGAPSGDAGGDLYGEYPDPGVAALRGVIISETPPTAGQRLKASSSSAAAWADDDIPDDYFGDGSDGDVTLVSTTTLSRDMFYEVLTLGSQRLDANGFRVFARQIVGPGTISNNGRHGVSGVSTATAAAGSGATGSVGSGGAWSAGLALASHADTVRGTGGQGGRGGGAYYYAGTGTPNGVSPMPVMLPQHGSVRDIAQGRSGRCLDGVVWTGGGAGTSGVTGGSGGQEQGAGGGGGVVVVIAKDLVGPLTIESNGGNGGSPTAGNSGGAAGGAGGTVVLIRHTTTGTITLRANGGHGGNAAGTELVLGTTATDHNGGAGGSVGPGSNNHGGQGGPGGSGAMAGAGIGGTGGAAGRSPNPGSPGNFFQAGGGGGGGGGAGRVLEFVI